MGKSKLFITGDCTMKYGLIFYFHIIQPAEFSIFNYVIMYTKLVKKKNRKVK